MAIRPFIAYPGKTAGVSPEYPDGKARNIVTPHDGLGTPWDEDLVNDMFGFFQGMLAAAGITASGTPETALDSQFLDALRALFLDVAGDTMEGALDLDDNQLLNVPDAPANGKAGVNADYVDDGDATTLSTAQGYSDSGDSTVASNAAAAREAMADGTATLAERIMLPQAAYTAETDTTKVLRPDGAGGTTWGDDPDPTTSGMDSRYGDGSLGNATNPDLTQPGVYNFQNLTLTGAVSVSRFAIIRCTGDFTSTATITVSNSVDNGASLLDQISSEYVAGIDASETVDNSGGNGGGMISLTGTSGPTQIGCGGYGTGENFTLGVRKIYGDTLLRSLVPLRGGSSGIGDDVGDGYSRPGGFIMFVVKGDMNCAGCSVICEGYTATSNSNQGGAVGGVVYVHCDGELNGLDISVNGKRGGGDGGVDDDGGGGAGGVIIVRARTMVGTMVWQGNGGGGGGDSASGGSGSVWWDVSVTNTASITRTQNAGVTQDGPAGVNGVSYSTAMVSDDFDKLDIGWLIV